MAQGLVKKASAPKHSSATKAGVSKRGSRQINPKNVKLIKQAKMNKKFTSGLTAQTEKMLGERAGHLEMLGGGKKKVVGGNKGAASKQPVKRNMGNKKG